MFYNLAQALLQTSNEKVHKPQLILKQVAYFSIGLLYNHSKCLCVRADTFEYSYYIWNTSLRLDIWAY
jgi:hypothetical protein